MKLPMFNFYFERVNTDENPFFLSLHQPRTPHEYYLCILAMFTMSRKDLKHVNRPSLAVLFLPVLKHVAC